MKYNFFLIFQSLGDYTDPFQAVAFYIVMASSLCTFSWLGNELSTHVCITDHHIFGVVLHVFITAVEVYSHWKYILSCPPLISIFNLYHTFFSTYFIILLTRAKIYCLYFKPIVYFESLVPTRNKQY